MTCARVECGDVVSFVVPEELAPELTGQVAPAVVMTDAAEPERADLAVLLWGRGPTWLRDVPRDAERFAPGTWHRRTDATRQLTFEVAELRAEVTEQLARLERQIEHLRSQLDILRAA